MKRGPRRRRRVGRAIIVVPSLFTLANLFFGFWSMVLAAQGEFYRASWWIVIAGVLDMLDGLLARVSKTGTRFGGELDSLVDIVSFGLAPAVLMYHLHFAAQGPFAWVFLYGFVVCVALRLARYNTQSGDGPKNAFTGLPTTAAGMALATYYPFTQTQFFQTQLTGAPWTQILIFLVIALSLAMVSNIQYAKVPRIGIRTPRGRLGLAVHLTLIGFAIWNRDIFFFPFGISYLAYGMVRSAVVGIQERGEEPDEDESEPADDVPFLVRDGELGRRRRKRGM